jgi:RNA polymerase sigma-70 factor, ECF subfamily
MDGGELSVEDAICVRSIRPAGRERLVRQARRGDAADEAALVRAAQSGSEQAVAALFDLHWDVAHRAALLITRDRAAAEDIAQEAFLAALRALPRFDRRRPLRPWLHRIVVNRAIDWARARQLRNEVDADGVAEIAGPEPDAGTWSEQVVDALALLTPEQRAAIVLRYLLDFTPREIASCLALPQGTVNSRLRRGLDALGAAFAQERQADAKEAR